jgi:Nitrogenase molybdenum-iron protein, alpha and beta chains
MSNGFIERPRAFCALGGAVIAATALPGVVPIIHASMGCGGSIYWNQYGSTGYLGAGYCGGLAVPSSNIQEKEVIFGGLERLEEQVRNTIKLVEGELYIVLTGCTTDIIGDNIRAVVNRFKGSGHGVIGAEAGGFRGDGYKGYDIVLEALANDYIEKKATVNPEKVNLWGVVPGQDAFWRGNLIMLRSLLEGLGLTVNSFFTEYDTLEGIRGAGDAALNIVVSEFFGINAAKAFDRRHGTLYLSTPFPIGPTASAEFLRRVGVALGLPDSRVEGVIQSETVRYFRYVERAADAFNDLDWQRYAVVVGDANYAPALTRFLADDLGWLPELMVVTNEVAEEERYVFDNAVSNLTSKYPVSIAYETDPTEIKAHFWKRIPRQSDSRYYDGFSPGFVVGSHLEREFANDIGAGHLTVSYPVVNRVVLNRGYAGFEGSLSLIEDLLSVITTQR